MDKYKKKQLKNKKYIWGIVFCFFVIFLYAVVKQYLENELTNVTTNKDTLQKTFKLRNKNLKNDVSKLFLKPKNNNILVVTNGIQPLVSNGGISMMFTRYVEIFRQENSVQILVPYKTKHSIFTKHYWTEHNVEFHSLTNTIGQQDYGTKEMKRSFQILKWILAHDHFDVIIFHDYRGIATHTIQMKLSGTALQKTKIVVTCHSSSRYSDLMNRRTPSTNDILVYGMEDFTRTYADLTIFPSRFFHSTMQNDSEMLDKMMNVKIIPNFIYDIERPTKRHDTIKSKKFAYYGRVDRLKGIEFLFNMLMSIKPGQIDEFLILGDINAPDIYDMVLTYKKILSKQNNINVKIVGSLPMKSALKFLRENNYIVIMSSYFENYSCALQELVFYGIPVLFSDAGGNKEIVKDTFYMYEIENLNQLKKMIYKGLHNGFKTQELTNDPEKSIELFKQNIFEPYNTIPTSVFDCSDVTIGIVTRGRKHMVQKLVDMLHTEQTCDGFSILILNNDNLMYLFHHETKQILRDNIIVSKARNELIYSCETPYLILFDDDDIPHPDMIYNLKTTLINTKASLASAPCNNIKDGVLEKVSLTSGFTNIAANLLIHHSGKATVILDVAFMRSIGGLYEEVGIESRSPFIDWAMYSKVILNYGKISLYPLPVYNYTKHSKSSLYYTATETMRYWGYIKIINMYCKQMKLSVSMCSLLQMAKMG